jgi:hypothetical protein
LQIQYLREQTPRLRGRGFGYPDALRAAVIAYVEAKQRCGMSLHRIADKLGLPLSTFWDWLDADAGA